VAKILVVDDSLFARVNICNILKAAGHEMVEAENGIEGLQKLAEHQPDCIISDLLMPELDGIGFLTALQEKQSRIPVIILTADIQEAKRLQCQRLGAAGFITKPPQKAEILALVHQILHAGEEG
jgi:CheY-like chemotaxis protein